MKSRILLINPPYPMEESPAPPLGLMSLAGYLLENDCEVLLEDYIVTPYSTKRLAGVINEFKPDLIGATGVTMNIKRAFSILKDVRDVAPNIPTVLGGPHATFDAENILADHPYINFVVRGEGELTTTELVKNLAKPDAWGSIKGLSFTYQGRHVHNEKRDFIEDINILPLPARHLAPLGKYRALGFPINMVTSRGCPFECIFCVGSRMVGRRVRYFDVKRVVDEFEMISKMGFVQVNIVDDLFTSNKKRCMDICNEIMRRGIKTRWGAFARVDTVSQDLLDTMHAAGCTVLCFGIESGVQEILNTIKKKTNLDLCRKAAQMCKDAGIDPMTSYILGLPGETPETVKQTMEFARSLSPNYGFHILSPFPGTEVRDKAAEYGMRVLTDDWDKYDANQSVAECVSISSQEVDRIVNEFNTAITNLIKSIIKRYENGEKVSDKDMLMIRGLRALDFNMILIHQELVEKYSADCAGSTSCSMDGFIDYLSKKMKFGRDEIASELDRLVSQNCLRQNAGTPFLSWV